MSNFSFLEKEFPLLYTIGISAESYLHSDPVYCLVKLRLFGEKMTEILFEEHALDFPPDNSFHNRLETLKEEKILPLAVKDLFYLLKKKGNQAVHDNVGTQAVATQGLEEAFKIAKWFYETYSEANQNIYMRTFRVPERTDDTLALQKLEAEYKALETTLNALLAERQTDGLSEEKQQAIQQRSEQAARKIEMSEAETRNLIDAMLRKAGWEVDTETINFKKHKTLPQKGKNRAIAEWPAGALWADYALFVGTDLYGFVEAKKYAQDISTDLRQTKIYAESVQTAHGATLLGQWETYRVPFLFSTNGRPYLEQIKTKSGIWSLDVRQKNQPGLSPTGLVFARWTGTTVGSGYSAGQPETGGYPP